MTKYKIIPWNLLTPGNKVMVNDSEEDNLTFIKIDGMYCKWWQNQGGNDPVMVTANFPAGFIRVRTGVYKPYTEDGES